MRSRSPKATVSSTLVRSAPVKWLANIAVFMASYAGALA